MADTAITVTRVDNEVHHRQAQMPKYIIGTWKADDILNHAMKLNARGKGRFTVAAQNKTDQTLTVTIYGMHSADAEVGEDGVFLIGEFTVLTAARGYETVNDPFPWYLIRETFSVTPNGTNVITYVNFSAY